MLSYAPFGSNESGKCALRHVFSIDLVGTDKDQPSPGDRGTCDLCTNASQQNPR